MFLYDLVNNYLSEYVIWCFYTKEVFLEVIYDRSLSIYRSSFYSITLDNN